MKTLTQWLLTLKTDTHSMGLLLFKGYLALTILCFIILLLPVSHQTEIPLIDQIFLAVSIVSTTGLSSVDFGSSYSFFGQFVSLCFIQLGGIGYMALATFIIIKQYHKIPRLSVGLLRLEFNLPQKYPLLQFIYSVGIFTVMIEIVGAVVLYFGFKEEGIDAALWYAIFHSISAFCTAGFSLFGDSMTSFSDNAFITTTILCLSLLGSIGFIVLFDLWYKLTGKRKGITLTSKIIITSTFVIWIIAAILLYFSDKTVIMTGWYGLSQAIFQSISAHTTVGFNNVDLSQYNLAGTFVLIIIMVIGASPAGTGGGIKTTSISAIFSVLISILKRKKHITFFNKEIPASNIYLAISSMIFYSTILLIGTWLILILDGSHFTFEKLLFEVASALSTVGLSTGITADLSIASKILICCLMFIGRLGVLTFGFALISESPLLRQKPRMEDIAI